MRPDLLPEGEWDRCQVCGEPIVLLGAWWHHGGPADHEAVSTGMATVSPS